MTLGPSVLRGEDEDWLEAGEFGRGVSPFGVVPLTLCPGRGWGPMK